LYGNDTAVDILYRFDGKLIQKDVEEGIYVTRGECDQTVTGATCYSGHDGIDYDMLEGEPVLAAAQGTVINAIASSGTVYIQHANGLLTVYLHLSAIYVDEDDPNRNTVNQGDVIGLAGQKGDASGPHLHFGVQQPDSEWKDIDPFGWQSLDPDPWSTYDTYGQTSTWLWKGDEAGDGYLTVDNRESQAQFFLPPSSNPPEPPEIGWHRLASGYDGEAWYSFMHTATDDLHKYWAIWGSTIEQPGEYTVRAYWPGDPDPNDEWQPASNARYTLYYHQNGALQKVFLYGNQTVGAGQFNPLCKEELVNGTCPADQIAQFSFGQGATTLSLENPALYDTSQHRRILFYDAVQWQPYTPPTPTPTQSPSPTTTNTPLPTSTFTPTAASTPAPVCNPTPGDDPYADCVIDFTANGSANGWKNPSMVVGAPSCSNWNFMSLGGGGGYVIVDMGAGEEIIDQLGADLKVHETGYGCGGVNEAYTVYASNSPVGPWVSLGSGNGTATFNIGGLLPKARYVKIVDPNGLDNYSGTPGADIDAIEALKPGYTCEDDWEHWFNACEEASASQSDARYLNVSYNLSSMFSSLQQTAVDSQLFYRVRDELLNLTPEGSQLSNLYYQHGPEIGSLLLLDPELDQEGLALLHYWEPKLQALVDGQGNAVVISQEEVSAVEDFLSSLEVIASNDLRIAIQSERAELNLSGLVGQTMSQAWEEISGTATATATPTATQTSTSTPTDAPTATVTPTFAPTATQTPTATPTFTPTASQTPTPPPNACVPSNSYGSSQGAFQFASWQLAANSTSFGRLPLAFVPNRGQEDASVRFQARGLGGSLFFTPSEVVFSLPNPMRVMENDRANVRYDLHPANVVRIHYQGANENPQIVALGQLPGVVNVLKGDNPSRWRTNLPTYSGITYKELYPGIELRYEGTDGQLKSTFHVAPGADPSAIVWRYRGVDTLSTDEDGNLVVNLPEPAGAGAVLLEQAPVAWQEVAGNRVMIPVQYAVSNNDKKVSFVFPDGYDATLPLVIDPTITYSTYLGGVRTDEGHAITLDADCNVYVTGDTSSSNFPTVNPFQQNPPTKDIFVSKLNAAGDTLLYSTYIGGNQSDQAWGIALDSQGRITVVGESESSDFPMGNAYDNTFGGGTCEDSEPCDDVVVVQLTSNGAALRYSTYLGGSQQDNGYGLAIGPGDKIHLTGATRSSTFPAFHAYDSSFGGGTCSSTPCYDAFVATIDPALTGSASLLYSSFLGNNNYDDGMGIAVDSNGHVYITGYTRSDGFPARSAYRSTRVGSTDAFIAKFNTALSGDASLLYSSYFGGSGDDRAFGIALNGANQVYITGFTKSTNFPMANPFDSTFGGGTCGSSACTDAFVTHLNIGNNSLIYSSYLGGGHHEEGLGITVDDNGNAYVTGFTQSTHFNTLAPIQASKATDSCSAPPCADAFVTNVSSTGALVYSTYLGGTAEDYGNAVVVDGIGNTYITGYTFSSNFPDAVNQYAGESGYSDAFVVKIED
jgi:hypothetical protein